MKLQWVGLAALGVTAALAATANDDDWDQSLASGAGLASQGRLRDALQALDQLREQAERFGPNDRRLALVLNNLGSIYLRLDDLASAERSYRRSAAIWEARGDAMNHLAPATNLAGVYIARRQYSTAETLLSRALQLTEAKLGPDNPQTAVVLTYLSDVACRRGDYSEAIARSERALEIMRRIHEGPHPDVAIALDNLGSMYRGQGNPAESRKLYTQAISVLEQSHNPKHPAWIRALSNYAATRFEQGDYAAARSLQERALAQAESTLGPDHPTVGKLLLDYAVILRKTGKKSEARKQDARAARILEHSAQANGLGYTVDARSLSGFR
jgi:tetratricopeptide (TPR) repeat protein